MTEAEVRRLIAGGESLMVEFKSDAARLPDADWIETVVCMANYQGGTLLVGVEDDGAITGLHPYHKTSPQAVAAFIASRTVPPLAVEVNFIDLPGGVIAAVTIPAVRQPISTSEGKLLLRYFDTKGKPGCRPLYSHEIIGWRADRGMADPSALPILEATWTDLDAVEFARLRRMVEENHGDAVLLDLTDEGIAHALGLVSSQESKAMITLAGLLLVGKEAALRQFLPAHEIAFQVLRGLDVAVNEFHRWPLLRAHEWLAQAVEVRNEEQELMLDGFRIGVPRYDRRGMREAINNALIHRDYARLGAVHVQLHDDHALISNPGGFVTGVNVDNLLIATPHPRNPLLADAFKRIGLVEKTGRGVGIIYTGQLQNGRLRPMYDRSTQVSVTVTLDSRPADLKFVESLIQANKRLGRALNVNELLILNEAWRERRLGLAYAAKLIQRADETEVRAVLEQMAEAGILKARGERQQRVYHSVGAVSLKASESASVENAQIEQTLLQYVKDHGKITRREAAELCRISQRQATYLLNKLMEKGILRLEGRGRGTKYVSPK
ncbi:MAG: RNA-binding domain-containing protein [candidate division KSB1 bacterium]